MVLHWIHLTVFRDQPSGLFIDELDPFQGGFPAIDHDRHDVVLTGVIGGFDHHPILIHDAHILHRLTLNFQHKVVIASKHGVDVYGFVIGHRFNWRAGGNAAQYRQFAAVQADAQTQRWRTTGAQQTDATIGPAALDVTLALQGLQQARDVGHSLDIQTLTNVNQARWFLVRLQVLLNEIEGVLFTFGQHPSIIGNKQGKNNGLLRSDGGPGFWAKHDFSQNSPDTDCVKWCQNSSGGEFMTQILIIQGHPSATENHLAHALAAAYRSGAEQAGHEVRTVSVGQLDFPLIRSQQNWQTSAVNEVIQAVQTDILWCQHLVVFFPLWMGGMPALLKAFFEQVARPDFAFSMDSENPLKIKKLKGRSARLVVTMGMPAWVYRWYFRAHGVQSLRRNILQFVGFKPVKTTLIGGIDQLAENRKQRWFEQLQQLGSQAH